MPDTMDLMMTAFAKTLSAFQDIHEINDAVMAGMLLGAAATMSARAHISKDLMLQTAAKNYEKSRVFDA